MASILAADDSPSIQQMVRLTLEAEGHEVVTVGDGTEALDEMDTEQFDLVITDINMPQMGGFELIKKLRKIADYQVTPIICLTTESNNEYKRKGKEAGANGWIVKPFDPSALIKIINRLL